MHLSYEQLPKKTTSAASLFLNDNEEVLVVKPTYKDGWSIPGGIVENDESIHDACVREVEEEIGLKKSPLKFLGVDYIHKGNSRSGHDALHFVFYGGVLNLDEIEKIRLPIEELSEYKFVTQKTLLDYLSKNLFRRISECLNVIHEIHQLFMENGEIII